MVVSAEERAAEGCLQVVPAEGRDVVFRCFALRPWVFSGMVSRIVGIMWFCTIMIVDREGRMTRIYVFWVSSLGFFGVDFTDCWDHAVLCNRDCEW